MFSENLSWLEQTLQAINYNSRSYLHPYFALFFQVWLNKLLTIFIFLPLWSQFKEIAVAEKMNQNIVGIKKKRIVWK